MTVSLRSLTDHGPLISPGVDGFSCRTHSNVNESPKRQPWSRRVTCGLLGMGMKAPDLDYVYETFVRLPLQLKLSEYFEILRTKIIPLIHLLRDEEVIDWYSFQIHNRDSGVPTTQDDPHKYVHLRLEVAPGFPMDELTKRLPASCLMTQQATDLREPKWNGINESLKAISEYWRVEGETSEWVRRMLEAHKGDVPPENVLQFFHWMHNQVQIFPPEGAIWWTPYTS